MASGQSSTGQSSWKQEATLQGQCSKGRFGRGVHFTLGVMFIRDMWGKGCPEQLWPECVVCIQA